MKHYLNDFLRAGAFFCVLLLVLVLLSSFFIQSDSFVFLNLHEMKTTDDIELAIVGSSIVRDHFNTALIGEVTGLHTFGAAVPSLSLQGEITLTRELYRTHSPQWTVLVVEAYNFATCKEDPAAQYKLMPYLSDPAVRLEYLLSTAREDGLWLDRLLPFRGFAPTGPADLLKTLRFRFDADAMYASLYGKTITSGEDTACYEGLGFVRHTGDGGDLADIIRTSMLPSSTEYDGGLLPASRDLLSAYRDLVAEYGSQLMLVISPALTVHPLSERGFLEYTDDLMRFCRENGIPCYNFLYAKKELLPNLDSTYFDPHHMNGEGADRFSAAFAEVFLRHTAGEDLSSLFYPDRSAYLASIDFITNCWLTASGENPAVLHADCNTGSAVTPQYRLFRLHDDGSETPLSDWTEAAVFTLDTPPTAETPVRLYARPSGSEHAPVYYDYPTDLKP